jgi:hypothetical protein
MKRSLVFSTGLQFTSAALASLGATQSGIVSPGDPQPLAVIMISATATEPIPAAPESLSGRPMTASEMIALARSMMGGDSSHMVDL